MDLTMHDHDICVKIAYCQSALSAHPVAGPAFASDAIRVALDTQGVKRDRAVASFAGAKPRRRISAPMPASWPRKARYPSAGSTVLPALKTLSCSRFATALS